METLVHGTSSTSTDTTGLSTTHTHTNTKVKNIPQTDQQMTSISYDQWWKAFWGMSHTKRHRDSGLHLFQTGYHVRVSEETLHRKGDGEGIHIWLNTFFYYNRQPAVFVFHDADELSLFQHHYSVWWILLHRFQGLRDQRKWYQFRAASRFLVD